MAYADIFPVDAPPPTPGGLEPSYRELLGDLATQTWVATVGEQAVGEQVIGSVVLIPDDTVPAGWRIERFNVHPDHQGVGVGASLYARALAAARSSGAAALNLWVLEANDRARAIYESWGWTLVPGRLLANEPPEVVDVLYELALS